MSISSSLGDKWFMSLNPIQSNRRRQGIVFLGLEFVVFVVVLVFWFRFGVSRFVLGRSIGFSFYSLSLRAWNQWL